MWRLLRRRRPPSGNGREREARDALRRERHETEKTGELIVQGELLADLVKRTLRAHQ